MAIFFNANVAEAGADIHYASVNVRIEPGKLIIEGYFYNNGDEGARVKRMHFFGNVGGVRVDSIFGGNNINVGYIDAYDARNWSFTILNDNFKVYDNNPNRNLKSSVTYGN